MTELLKTAYSQKQATQYDAIRFTSEGGIWAHRKELDLVSMALSSLPPEAHILEVGCGTGRLLIELAQKGHHLSGIEPSPWMRDELSDKIDDLSLHAEICAGEAGSLPHQNDSFDYTYAVRTLNLTESKEYALNAFAEMIRVTKPGGYIFVDILNYYRLRYQRLPLPNIPMKPKEFIAVAKEKNCERVFCRGAFFFGLASYPKLPDFIIPFITPVDNICCRILPFLANRNYLLFRKGI